MVDPQAKRTTRPPKHEQLIQAMLFVLEGHSVPARYLDALTAIIERARRRGRRQAA